MCVSGGLIENIQMIKWYRKSRFAWKECMNSEKESQTTNFQIDGAGDIIIFGIIKIFDKAVHQGLLN